MSTPTILIIEDNPISRKTLKLTLESEHYSVTEAIDGTSALIAAENQDFDLIIQDLILPDIDGFVLNKKLRTMPKFKNTPIFALSGFLSKRTHQHDQNGFTTFLLKPIDPSYLLNVVKANLPISMPSKILAAKGKHILIADDNPIQLKLFSMQLKNLGFEVTAALDGVIALAKATAIRPDAIISDVLMPNLDGFSLCIEIKRDPTLCMIPVILLTSHYLDNDDLELARKVGASVFLTRTPDQEELIFELQKILSTKLSEIPTDPIELTDDIKEKHTIRSIRLLEQHVLDNAQLAQRCAMLMSQLSLIDGIANSLTTTCKDIDESLKEVLYFCLDALGISKGALYIKALNNNMVLNQQIGYSSAEIQNVKSFFGIADEVSEIIKENKPFEIPSQKLSGTLAQKFLDEAHVSSALIVPLFSGSECLGILYLGSDMADLSGNNTRELVHTLGMQFGQSIALASAFEKLGSSDKRYRHLVEISLDAIFIIQNEKFVYANSSALKLLNAKNENELLSFHFYDFFPLEYQKVIQRYIEKNKNQGSTSLSEGQIINLKGDILDVEIVVSPFLYLENNAIYMIMRDITDRKRSALHLEIQYSIAWVLAESASLFVATAKILKIIGERLEWDCGAIWAIDKEANVLRCNQNWQISEIQSKAFELECQTLSFKLGIGLPGETWEHRKVTWKSDLSYDETMMRNNSISEMGLTTAVAFPIVYENEVLGVIEFYSKKSLKSNYELLTWLESIGNQLGLFLNRKHMGKQMLDIAEHDTVSVVQP